MHGQGRSVGAEVRRAVDVRRRVPAGDGHVFPRHGDVALTVPHKPRHAIRIESKRRHNKKGDKKRTLEE